MDLRYDWDRSCCFRPELPTGGCKILTEPLCRTRGRCPFARTAEQARRAREKSAARAREKGCAVAGRYTGGEI